MTINLTHAQSTTVDCNDLNPNALLLKCDLRDAPLSGANLKNADLSGADLSGVDMSYADLSGANLSQTFTSGMYFRGANLSMESIYDKLEVKDQNKLPIASFVNQTKNPQYYVDRYFNETMYKKWFDKDIPLEVIDNMYKRNNFIPELFEIKAPPTTVKNKKNKLKFS